MPFCRSGQNSIFRKVRTSPKNDSRQPKTQRILEILFLSSQFLYALLTLVLWAAWWRTPAFGKSGPAATTTISVVVVVRNEAANIGGLLQTLAAQSYPAQRFEVLVVDDFSTDATAALVGAFARQSGFKLRLLNLQDHPGGEYLNGNHKKKAIEWAVDEAAGELIVTTDGDCLAPENWLSIIAAFYARTRARMICGGVTFVPETSFFARLQTVEFASLIGSGAATLRLGVPTMCNAANLAFAKRAFLEVGGYQGTAATATGDDLFLMHKIHRRHPSQVRFLKNPQAVVRTLPQATPGGFYQQRKRWASKWSLYQDKRVSGLAAFVFAANLLAVGGLLAAAAGHISWSVLLAGLAARWLAEWFFLVSVLRFLQKRHAVCWIPVVQWIYPFYVVLFGLAAQRKGYRWKGRDLR